MEFEEYADIYEHPFDDGSGYYSDNYTYNGTAFYLYEDEMSGMDKFRRAYGDVHGYLCIFTSIFGIAANIINVIVLSRKHMASPTNSILMALGIVDMIALFTYILFIGYSKFYSHNEPHWGYIFNENKAWIDYAIFWPHISFTFEIYGMWLTITLALFQYVSVCHIKMGPRLCTIKNSNITILVVGCVSLLMCLPEYMLYETRPVPSEFNKSGWILSDSFIVEKSPGMKDFYLIFYGIVVKILSCVLLITLSGLLIRTIYLAGVRRASFVRQNSEERKNSARRKVNQRTTVMLVAVMMLFVLTEFPYGLLAFIGGCDRRFFDKVFLPLTELFTLLVIINSAVKFILYCTMSQQFRKTFIKLLFKKLPKVLKFKSAESEITTTTSSFKSRMAHSEETNLDEP